MHKVQDSPDLYAFHDRGGCRRLWREDLRFSGLALIVACLVNLGHNRRVCARRAQ